MTSFDHDLDGLDEQLAQLQREQEQWSDDDGVWYVGTAVEYSIYLELGTSEMDPKPFVQPAIHEVESAGVAGFIEDHTNKTVEAITSVDELVRTLAFALERRIKQIITRKGLIDTGALRASVAAVPAESALKDVSDVASLAEVDIDPSEVEGTAT